MAYFLDRLFVAHGRAERLVCRALADVPVGGIRLGGRLLWERTWRLDPADGTLQPHGSRPGSDAGRRLWEETAPLLRAVRRLADGIGGLPGAGEAPLERSILLRDYAGHGRRQLVLFLFGPEDHEPWAVVKAAAPSAGDGRERPGSEPLAREARALRRLREELPAPLALTVPAPLAYVETGRAAVLALAPLGGRSAYVEMQNRLLPGRRVDAHLRAAADWLSAFHEATRRPGERAAVTDADRAHAARLAGGAGGEVPAWLERLDAALERSPVPLTAAHGDFWARNLLLAGGEGRVGSDGAIPPVGVVDWEHYAPAAPPFVDLFHFATSYGRAWRWRGTGRTDLPGAFRRTFLEANRVSRAVTDYLARYVRRTGLDRSLLGPLLRLHLLRRHRDAATAAESAEWETCLRGLEEAQGRSEIPSVRNWVA